MTIYNPVHELDVCIDCRKLLANGEYDPELTEAECEEYAERVEANWPSAEWDITLGSITCEHCGIPKFTEECESTGFAYSGCDLCHSFGPRQGGGDRYHATASPRTVESAGRSIEVLALGLAYAERDVTRSDGEISKLEERLDDLEWEVKEAALRLADGVSPAEVLRDLLAALDIEYDATPAKLAIASPAQLAEYMIRQTI